MENFCQVNKNRRQQTADVWVSWNLGRLNQFHDQIYWLQIRAIFFRLPTIRQIHFVQIRTGYLIFSLPLSVVFNQPRLTDWISLQNIGDICFSMARHVATLWTRLTKLAFSTSGLSCTSYFRSPNWQRNTTKASEKFHPLSLYYFRRIFGERSYPPKNCESQNSKVSFPDLVLADRARKLKIQNGRHKT